MGYMDHSREFGIEIDGYRLDMEQVQARKNKIVKDVDRRSGISAEVQ